MPDVPKIFPLGDGCVTAEFGNQISADLNAKAISLAAYFRQHPFPGFIESVPAYSSASIFFDLIEVRRSFPEEDSAFDAVSKLIREALLQPDTELQIESRSIEIPVDFGVEAALDIDHVAAYAGIARHEVIDRFTSKTYRVYMLGFLPGFAYMGEVDEMIAAPRRTSPRKKVPKGSVGIASRQTGIYSLESPGGWQIIGRTDVELFTPGSECPAMLRPGDEVRFLPR